MAREGRHGRLEQPPLVTTAVGSAVQSMSKEAGRSPTSEIQREGSVCQGTAAPGSVQPVHMAAPFTKYDIIMCNRDPTSRESMSAHGLSFTARGTPFGTFGKTSSPRAVITDGTTSGTTSQRIAHTGRPTVTFTATPTEIFEYNIDDNIEHMKALGYPCNFNFLTKNPGTITDRVFGNDDNVSKLVMTTTLGV